MLATQAPFTQYFDTDGSPLDNGKVYFGVANQNPETNPIAVYWDSAGTQPAAQPISTLNGYPARNGTPALIYAPGDYALSVRNKKGLLAYYAPSSAAISSALALSITLADATSPVNGAGQIGFGYALGYAAGTVARWLQDLALGAGSTFVGYIAAGVGAVLRDVRSKLRDILSVLDFGAGVAGLPIATNLGGGEYLIPAGTYVYAAGLVADYSSAVFPSFLVASPRVSLRGNSIHNTFLNYNGGAATYALTLTGPATFATEGLYSNSKYGNFMMQDVGATQTRNGVSATNLSDLELDTLGVMRFNIGLYINSCLSSIMKNVKMRYNLVGMVLDNTTGQSNPNAISFTDCDWTANTNQGVIANVVGATNRFSSCRVEANGVQGAGTNGGMAFSIRTDNGPASMLFEGCYFENNAGGFDVFLTNTQSGNATVVFLNCEFNRASSARYVTTNVGAGNSGAGTLRVTFIGCSFFSAGTYVPSAARPFFSASDNKVLFIDGGGNSFSEDTSRQAAFYNDGGWVTGAGGVISAATPYSAVRTGVGTYTITSSVPFGPTTSDFNALITVLSAFSVGASVEKLTNQSFRVHTWATGTATAADADFSFQVVGAKGL